MSKIEQILYVEDDDDIRNIATMVFELGGIDVISCESGEVALEKLQSHKPQLALVDVMMPGMDGLMLIKKIKKANYTFPVIFMTAKTQKDEIQNYMDAGVVAVISKPFNPENLISEVQSIYDEVSQ